VAKAAFGGFRKETNDELGSTADDAGAWGRNIAIQLARGIAAAGVAVIQALKSIGNIISHWLAPGSPPRLLPQIDQWGTAAMQEFLDGMGEASVGALRSMGGRIMATLGGIQEAGLVGLFSTISGTVQRLMQSTAQEDDQGLIGRIMGSRGVIAQAVQDIQQYGQVSADTLAGIQQAMVGLPAVANDYVAAMLRLYEANQAVTAAQENLNAVTQQYDDQLRPLREELEGIQDAQADEADQRRIAQLQRAIARGALNDEQRAQAEREIRARQLAMQIRAIEEERDTAVDSAQDQLDAAEEQQRAAQAAVDLQQALIDANLENNSLIAEQVSLLQRLADAMSAIGPAIGDAISDALGDGLAASLGDGLDLGEVLDTGDDPLGLSSILDDMDIQGLVDEILAEFAPLQEEAEGLGGIFGGISENWDSLTEKANPLVEGLKLVAGGFAAIKVGGLAVSLLSTVGGFLSAGGAAGGFGASLLALAGPVGIIAAVIAGLAVLVATDFMGIRTTSEQLVFIIEWFFTVKIPEAIEAAGAAIQAWADNTRAWLSAAGQSAATWAASLGATVKGAFLELYNNAATALSQLWAIIQYYFWSAVNTASTAATQLVQIVLFNLQQLLANALTAGTQLVEIIRFAFWWVLNTASQAATQLVLFLFIKWNQIKAKTLELKKYIAERFQEVVDWFKDVGEKAGEMAETIQTAAGNAKDFINGLWDAIKGFWEWLKGKVFDFHINIPQLPDWATPGSPIPLHTAWKNFAEDMNGLVIKPEMDLPTAVPMPGAPGVGAPTLAPAAAGARTVQILGDIQLADDTAVDAFLAWLSTLQDADALGGTALVYGG